MKTCTKCKVEKEHAAFSKMSKSKDGLQSQCRECQREYRAANKERIAERKRKYVRENWEREQERKRQWYVSNKERHQESGRQWVSKNRDRVREYKRAWHEENFERIRDTRNEYGRKWKQENRERVNSHAHARRARKVGLYGEKPDHKRIAEQMELLKDDPCLWCGTTEAGEYEWDHIVPLAKGGPHEWWNIARSCSSCNLSKHDKIPPLVGLYDWKTY